MASPKDLAELSAREVLSSLFLCAFATAALHAVWGQARLREPLPIRAVASLNSHNARSPIEISSDGQWIAHTFSLPDTVRRDTWGYTASGVPLAEGSGRMVAALTNTKTGQVIRLGSERASNWGAVWSPDSRRVAFYSDEGGEAGLWIWDRASSASKRVPGFIVRPFFGFETPRWLPDSRRLLCKVLPSGRSLAQANAPIIEKGRFKHVGLDKPSVFVLRAGPSAQTQGLENANVLPAAKDSATLADLALIDVQNGKITRLAQRAEVRTYGISPDGKYVAYTVGGAFEPNTQQPIYNLNLIALSTGSRRSLATGVRMANGSGWSWSPDSLKVAYFAGGQIAQGELFVVSVEGDGPRKLGGIGVPSLGGNGEQVPLWEPQSRSILALGADGKVWRLDIRSTTANILASIENRAIVALVHHPGSGSVWFPKDGSASMIWALARERRGRHSGIYKIDPTTGSVDTVFEEVGKRYLGEFNLDISAATDEVAYVMTDQSHPFDIWLFNTANHQARQATHLNPAIERYELGLARVIEWKTSDGNTRRGSLLLPSSYRDGQRIPLVLWIYGGSNGSASVDTFGLIDAGTFNMQVLATRGYAVLFPDAPERPGYPMQDVKDAALSAVDAAIEQGYADPNRLVLMGQSYGSYGALAVIVQSTRFKAAVITGAGTLHPDLIASYLEMAADGSAENVGYYEKGQGNMQSTPWTLRDRYLQNSPIFLFDRIETPLLIGVGEHDGQLFATDAVFLALNRLGKSVEYRIYEDEGHVLRSPPNVVDFWNRRLDFIGLNIGR